MNRAIEMSFLYKEEDIFYFKIYYFFLKKIKHNILKQYKIMKKKKF